MKKQQTNKIKKIKLLNYLVIKLAIPTRVGKSTREKYTPLPLL